MATGALPHCVFGKIRFTAENHACVASNKHFRCFVPTNAGKSFSGHMNSMYWRERKEMEIVEKLRPNGCVGP